MSFDIDHLGIEELEALNARIIERLKLLDRIRAQHAMMALNLGTRVSFDTARHGRVFGTVIRFNQKTVVVLTDDEKQWRVPPHVLSPIKDATPEQSAVRSDDASPEQIDSTKTRPVQ